MNFQQHQPPANPQAQDSANVATPKSIERLVADGHPIALYLDIDGTLLDVALTPSSVHIPPQLAGLLTSLAAALDGALAIVTGRRIEDADGLLAPFRSTAAGVHGAQMRRDAHEEITRLSPGLDEEIVTRIGHIVERIPGIMLENKGAGVTLHYRRAPERKPDLLQALNELLPHHGERFTICGGRKVVEVLPVGYSKGRALRHLAELAPFAGRTPVMIGDDVSDESAFAAARDLRGYGFKVAGENFSSEEAQFGSPREVLAWLEHLERLARQSKAIRQQPPSASQS